MPLRMLLRGEKTHFRRLTSPGGNAVVFYWHLKIHIFKVTLDSHISRGQFEEEAEQGDINSMSMALGSNHVDEAWFFFFFILGFLSPQLWQRGCRQIRSSAETPSPDERPLIAVSLVWQRRWREGGEGEVNAMATDQGIFWAGACRIRDRLLSECQTHTHSCAHTHLKRCSCSVTKQ